ncbi:unnamed protein product [Durusdinium trenchii]|uniref:Major facilitator superfamily (MFS) profile domain-containing protein n=1 Tax=Durusdinium trenchii TaxID=1381693 RepID=A0ABP0N6Z0_9DINO
MFSTYTGLAAMLLACMYYGCPAKQSRDPNMAGSRVLTVYLGLVIGLLYFSTDQYLPSLPEMEVELGGSEMLLSGSVQLNLFLKCLAGLIVAPLSDQVGRQPIFATCATLLILGSLGCALAPDVNWFLAARVIQSLGESLEPLIFAIIRDCYQDEQERLVAVSLVGSLMMMGIALGPVVGGLVASLCHWRVPFLALSLAWALMALFAVLWLHETAAGSKGGNYWQNVKRVFCDRHLVTILLTEILVLSTYYSFNANVSYLTEGVYGMSTVSTSWMMGAFSLISAIGMIIVTNSKSPVLSTAARLWMTLFSLGAGGSFVVAALFYQDDLWSYMGSSFLMGFFLACYMPLSVLYLERVEDIAGTAASFEVFAQAGPPAIYSAVATQGIIHGGQRGLTAFQAGSTLLAGIVFWIGYSNEAAEEADEG